MKQSIPYRTLLISQLFLALATGPFTLASQQVRVSASLDTSVLMIGDQTRLILEAVAPESYRIIWPTIQDTIIKQVEVVRRSSIDTLRGTTEPGMITWRQELIITAFDSGYYAVPPFVFLYKMPESPDYEGAETEAMLLEVFNPRVNMRSDIKDITGPLRAPVTFAEIWPWLLAGILAAGMILSVAYYLKRRKRDQPLITFRRKPPQPAHLVALDALDKLRVKKLWQSGKIKSYHTELTEIIRTYIETKFKIPAAEMVTPEIVSAVAGTSIGSTTVAKLKEMLELADLVKFAKENPLPDEHERSLGQAFDFVNESMAYGEFIPASDEETFVKETHSKVER